MKKIGARNRVEMAMWAYETNECAPDLIQDLDVRIVNAVSGELRSATTP
jgi:hypothetical protein